MMKLRLIFLVIISCTLLYRVACNEGLIKFPKNSSKVHIKWIMPECFIERVDVFFNYTLKTNNSWIDLKTNPQRFQFIVSKMLDEILKLLDQFTVLIVAIVERNKDMTSLESVFNYAELSISKLSRCLEFLFDNEAKMTDVLTGYIFFSDIKYIFKTYHREDYTYINVVDLFVRVKKQQWEECLQQVPTENTYQTLYREVEQTLEDIYNIYQQPIVKASVWLSPQRLKWRHLLESNSDIVDVFKINVDADKPSLYMQSFEIAPEFDSAKVMDFYVEVGKLLDGTVLQAAIEMMALFYNLIVRLILDGSNKQNSFKHISVAQKIVENVLLTIMYFENWMYYNKRLRNSKTLKNNSEIKMLQESVSFCKEFNSDNFPDILVDFLYKFEEIIKKFVSGIEHNYTNVANILQQDSFNQIDIIDSMGKYSDLIKMLFLEVKASST